MLNIEPIKLLSGSHPDTAKTGSGCFMNVIAYLNGEPQITDQSECVCATIRPIAIWLNDYMNDDERSMLIQFIHRAMGTATNDLDILVKRARRAVIFADEMAESAKYAKSAAESAMSAAYYAAESAESAESARSARYARYAMSARCAAMSAESAAMSARSAAMSAESAPLRKKIIDAGLRYLDDVCPMADEPTRELLCRANALVELATCHGD